MEILAFFTSGGSPATGLSATIDVWLIGTGQVVTAAAMTEVGGGFYSYTFSAYDPTNDYAFRADGGSTLSGGDRYKSGSNFIAAVEEKLPTNYIMGSSDQDDHDTTIDAIDGRLPSDPADQSAVEAAISASETAVVAEVDANETKIDALALAIAALNDLSSADVQAALDAQGYTSVRAALLDLLTEVHAAAAHRALISPDDLEVTIFAADGLTPVLEFDISADKRERTPK